jgi:hypothetical protein
VQENTVLFLQPMYLEMSRPTFLGGGDMYDPKKSQP